MDKIKKDVMPKEEETPAYIGRKKCGCVVAAVVDNGLMPKEVSKSVALFIARGLTIERVTVGYVRTQWHKCRHTQEGDK